MKKSLHFNFIARIKKGCISAFAGRKSKINLIVYQLIFTLIYTPIGYSQTPIITLGNPYPLQVDYFGANGANTWQNPGGWQNPILTNLFPLLNFGNSRYPGGTFSNWVNWQTGRGQNMLENGFSLPAEYLAPGFDPLVFNTLDSYASSLG